MQLNVKGTHRVREVASRGNIRTDELRVLREIARHSSKILTGGVVIVEKNLDHEQPSGTKSKEQHVQECRNTP